MTGAPQSIPATYRLPASILALLAGLGAWPGAGASAQAVAPPAPAAAPGSLFSILAGSAFSAAPGAPAIGTFEVPTRVSVVERRGGWAHVHLDAWVPEHALADTSETAGISAADIRAAPDKYVGRTVEWTLQVLAIQKADELRPELPEGQPYVLASGPLPETGFVYLAIPTTEVDSFRALGPLAKVRVRATIRAGRSRFLPTPVLTFVRRLE